MADRTVPLFSIGAVARMLDLSAATIRTWETRYGDVVPQRSQGGQRDVEGVHHGVHLRKNWSLLDPCSAT